jgi:hypothetical protein
MRSSRHHGRAGIRASGGARACWRVTRVPRPPPIGPIGPRLPRPRAHECQGAYGLGVNSLIVDPPDKLLEALQELAREDRQELTSRHGRNQARPVGCPDRRLQGGRRRIDLALGSPGSGRVPLAFAKKREQQWLDPAGEAK